MEIRFLGHAAVHLAGSKNIYIDPFLTGNDKAAMAAEDIREADFVVVTHDHADHLGDALAICKRTGAILVSVFEITERAEREGIATEPMNIGGSVENDGVTFHLANASHSSPGSAPTGVLIEMDGKTVYHMGDTGLLADMAFLPDYFNIDLAFVPIGDRFTMGARSAAKAVELCKAKIAVPIHFGTFPIIDQSADKFVEFAKDKAEVRVLEPGQTTEI